MGYIASVDNKFSITGGATWSVIRDIVGGTQTGKIWVGQSMKPIPNLKFSDAETL